MNLVKISEIIQDDTNEEMCLSNLVSLIDLTRLEWNDSVENIKKFCEQAHTPQGWVASVCVYPRFIATAAQELYHTPVKITTVANFPQGTTDINALQQQIIQAEADGAHEIDIVIPYQKVLSTQNLDIIESFVQSCRESASPQTNLKMILETGAFQQYSEMLKKIAEKIIPSGVHFLKTSTGKNPYPGADLESTAMLLQQIQQSSKKIGFKISGGIKTLAIAIPFLKLAKHFFQTDYLSSQQFRIGTSSLLSDLFPMSTSNRAY